MPDSPSGADSGSAQDGLYDTHPTTGRDLWVLPTTGKPTPMVVVRTNADEQTGQFSPDGRFIAYVCNETGRGEIHVRLLSEPPVATLGFLPYDVAPDGRRFLMTVDPDYKASPNLTVFLDWSSATRE